MLAKKTFLIMDIMPVLLQILKTETIFTQNSTLKCNRSSCTRAKGMSHIVAYVKKDKIWPRVNFVTIFGELYQIII